MRSVRIATGILCQLFIASALFAAELAVPQQVTDWRKAAEAAVQEKDFKTAVNLHAKIASSFPALAMDAQSDIAVTHLLSGNKQLADEELARMWGYRNKPGFVEAVQRIKSQYWWSGHRQESQVLCEQIMAACPDDPQTMFVHGDYIRGFIAMGTPEKAKQSFDRFMSLYGKNEKIVPILVAIKNEYWWGGYREDSQGVCESILAAYPDDPQTMAVHGDYIRGCIAMGQTEKANPSLDSFMTRYGKNKEAVPALVSIKSDYWFAGCRKESQALCESIMAAYPDDPLTMAVHGDYIRGCIAMGQTEKARQSLDSFLMQFGKNEKVVPMLGMIKSEYWLSGHQKESQSLCERIIAAYPDDPQTMFIHSDYIRGCAAMGHDDGFSEELEVYWNKYHDQPDFLAATQGIVSECLYGAHDVSRAMEISQRLLKDYPSHENTMITERDIIAIYLEMGSKEMADARLETLKANYASNTNLPAVLNHLGNRYRFQQHHEDAISLHHAALTLKPTPNEQVESYAGMAKAQVRLLSTGTEGQATAIQPEVIVEKLIQDYKEVISIGFHVFQIGEEYYFRAEDARKKGRDTDASSDYAKAIAIWQYNISRIDDTHHKCLALYYTGRIYNHQQDYRSAIECSSQILSHSPNYGNIDDVILLCGNSYELLYKAEGQLAIDEIEFASKLVDVLSSKGTLSMVPNLCWTIGEARYNAGQWKNAARYLECYLRGQNNQQIDPEVYYLLAQAYDKLGDTTKTIEYLRCYACEAEPDKEHWMEAQMKLSTLINENVI